RQIRIVDAVATQIRKIARRVAGNLIAGITEAVGVQNRLTRCSGLVIADAGRELWADHVRPLRTIGKSRIGESKGQGRTSLEGKNRGDGPPTGDGIQNPVHIMANPPPTANGNFDDGSKSKAMCCIVRADGMFRFEIIENLRVAGAEQPGNE